MTNTQGSLDCILHQRVGSFYSELFKEGAEPLSQQKPIKMQNHTDPSQLKVVEGVEKGHSSHSTQAEIKAKLGFDPNTVAKQTINLDSQVKYCVLAVDKQTSTSDCQ